jgi:hypothetical protein
MVGKGHRASGTGQDLSALLTADLGGVTAAVKEKDGLITVFIHTVK